jgi:hypothetical protein
MAHGRIQAIQGPSLTVQLDDGRVVPVDVTHVRSDLKTALQPGAGVTIVGQGAPPATAALAAAYVIPDAALPWTAASAPPATGVEPWSGVKIGPRYDVATPQAALPPSPAAPPAAPAPSGGDGISVYKAPPLSR